MYEGTIDQSPYQRMTITCDLVSAIYGRQCYVLIRLGNMGILTHGKPSNRERGSAHKCITDG